MLKNHKHLKLLLTLTLMLLSNYFCTIYAITTATTITTQSGIISTDATTSTTQSGVISTSTATPTTTPAVAATAASESASGLDSDSSRKRKPKRNEETIIKRPRLASTTVTSSSYAISSSISSTASAASSSLTSTDYSMLPPEEVKTRLISTIKEGDDAVKFAALLQELIAKGEKIDFNATKISDYPTLLYLAAAKSRYNICGCLINNRADINTKNSDGVSLLYSLLPSPDMEDQRITFNLINLGANVNTDNPKEVDLIINAIMMSIISTQDEQDLKGFYETAPYTYHQLILLLVLKKCNAATIDKICSKSEKCGYTNFKKLLCKTLIPITDKIIRQGNIYRINPETFNLITKINIEKDIANKTLCVDTGTKSETEEYTDTDSDISIDEHKDSGLI